ncbi:MAG: GvpL/GvpF family gas vesicle protein [Candidatus Brocadiales bacterium]|nr:GvpL/GvpF family gas vesicle protein [Candidatus Brocadiales bacterium]
MHNYAASLREWTRWEESRDGFSKGLSNKGTVTAAMKNPYLYVYCLCKDSSPLHVLRLRGIESEPVLLLPHGGLIVAYSSVAWKAASLRKQAKEVSWIMSRVGEHERVVEEIMRNYAILPMKFLTLFRSERSLLNTLEPHLPVLLHYLEHIHGKEEWALKVYSNEAKGLKHLQESDAYIREMNRKTFGTHGERYLHMKRMEELTHEGFANALHGIVEDIYETLINLSEEGKAINAYGRTVTERGEEDVVFNGAFLVSKQKFKTFREKVKSLKERHRPWGLSFELTGPWPPYNFCPNMEETVSNKVRDL